MPKPRFPPEFEDLVHLFGRLKDASVRTAVEELEGERKKAEQLGRDYVAARDAYKGGWRHEWQEFALLIIRLLSDAFVFAGLWAILWFAHAIQTWLPVDGRAGLTLATMHEFATIALYGVLTAFVLWDMVEVRLARRRRG